MWLHITCQDMLGGIEQNNGNSEKIQPTAMPKVETYIHDTIRE